MDNTPTSRRQFLQAIGATAAIVSAGCTGARWWEDDEAEPAGDADADQDQPIGDEQQNDGPKNTNGGESEGPLSEDEDEDEDEDGDDVDEEPTGDDAGDDGEEEADEQQERNQDLSDAPDDATDAVELLNHEIQIEHAEEGSSEYVEYAIVGEFTADYDLEDVVIEAMGIDENEDIVSHEHARFATVDAGETYPFEIRLYDDGDEIEWYHAAVADASYAQ